MQKEQINLNRKYKTFAYNFLSVDVVCSNRWTCDVFSSCNEIPITTQKNTLNAEANEKYEIGRFK